ncbi:family 65 glycosyl hydrolase domain-containing protein [Saccharicrinis sp. FJH54]|uniref:family 65 glycosyl hydrolase domain-containing protein n=1 Tax=Saccharicrinis sp. FJH54 TaxID=3344665 RepID=UPI0035D4FEA0
MNNIIEKDNWKIIQYRFDPEMQEAAESIFSIGNGKMGQRANFEEYFSGDSLQGSYIAGIYYPDKTRVGWWKNGYPEYFAKVLNSPSFIPVHVTVENEVLDLATWQVVEFERVLDMQEGVLYRTFTAVSPLGKKIQVKTERFLSMDDRETAAIRYSISLPDRGANILIKPGIDGDVKNRDSNYDEVFWNILETENKTLTNHLLAQTRKLNFRVAYSMHNKLFLNQVELTATPNHIATDKKIESAYEVYLDKGLELILEKHVSVISSLNHPADQLAKLAVERVKNAARTGYAQLKQNHAAWWAKKWHDSDIVIEGDVAAQQGIRFNIFQLNQTYTGDDPRLNVGPKGFTGEKYGGSTYWDTEAYCVPFFLGTAPAEVTRNLLLYRYRHLGKAIENANKLGFNNGAALYPMVTMNGEECHNEWEITFEEIHRNGAIAYAIYNYTEYTGDKTYLEDYGLEVLIGISRFWASRVNWSEEKQKYVILGVTGPNEYENNVNNNWYTNYIAAWCMRYTISVIHDLRNSGAQKLLAVLGKTAFDENKEIRKWDDIIEKIYLPFDEERGIFLQQDGYLDKQDQLAEEIPDSERPINQHWSWDRILRSCFIKQADVLQGMFIFEHEFDYNTIKTNYEFYEPRCVHESSLSPCVHSIIATGLGKTERAYELYLRTSRLDLDDYNKEVAEGLHITSMAGTWMSVVLGFGGVKVRNGKLHINPVLPDGWQQFSFKINFRERILIVTINDTGVELSLEKGNDLELFLNGNLMVIN